MLLKGLRRNDDAMKNSCWYSNQITHINQRLILVWLYYYYRHLLCHSLLHFIHYSA